MSIGHDHEPKAVQVGLGEAVVRAIQEFASTDIESVGSLEAGLFQRIRDPKLRKKLAETLFGARWLYKLGLVTLATRERRAAHVRAQIVDYSAICEAVLLDAITHGVVSAHLTGTLWRSFRGVPARWPSTTAAVRKQIRKERNFFWLIEVGKDEKVFVAEFAERLHRLREHRNNVHIAEMAAVDESVYLSTSKEAYQTMMTCVDHVSAWLSLHP